MKHIVFDSISEQWKIEGEKLVVKLYYPHAVGPSMTMIILKNTSVAA